LGVFLSNKLINIQCKRNPTLVIILLTNKVQNVFACVCYEQLIKESLEIKTEIQNANSADE
jgi:hypothetical protein